MLHTQLNPNIHGARGLFSLMVFVFHVANSGLQTFAIASGTVVEELLRTGKFGVELFFAISGVVIIGSLARAPSTAKFLFDRYARILPVLWVTIWLLVPMALLLGRRLPAPTSLALSLFAPPPFLEVSLIHPAAWSLGYEFTFYWLCAGWVSLRSYPSLRTWVLVPLSVVLLACYPRALLFVAGVWIASGRARGQLVSRLAHHPSALLLCYLILWRLLEVRALEDTSNLSPLVMPLSAWLGVLPFLLFAAAVGSVAMLGVEQGHGALGACLRTRPLQWLGTISYSFYLWHPLVLAVVKQLMRSVGAAQAVGPMAQLLLGVVALPISLAVSHVSQELIEIRVTRWLKQRGAAARVAVRAEAS